MNMNDFECEIPNVSVVEILLKTRPLSQSCFDYKAMLLPLPLQKDLHAIVQSHSAPCGNVVVDEALVLRTWKARYEQAMEPFNKPQ